MAKLVAVAQTAKRAKTSAKVAAQRTKATRAFQLKKQRMADKHARKMAGIAQNKSAQAIKSIDAIKQQAIVSSIGNTVKGTAKSFADMGANISANKANAAISKYNSMINGNPQDSSIKLPDNSQYIDGDYINIDDRG